MGWATGQNRDGREVGYAVGAVCDLDGCNEQIDRGLGYVCGGMHDGGEYGCGKYFCAAHLFYSSCDDQLCERCVDEWNKAHTCPECGEDVDVPHEFCADCAGEVPHGR